jgi:hypothetical protein
MSADLLAAGHALLRRLRDGAWPPSLPRPARLRLFRQGYGRLDLHITHEDGQALPYPWTLFVGGDVPSTLPFAETAVLLEVLPHADPDIEEALIYPGAAVVFPPCPRGSNIPACDRPIRLRALPGPPPFPLLPDHRHAEAVRRLLVAGLEDGEHALVPVMEPSAHRRLARQPLLQILEETGVDTALGPDSRLAFLQEEGVGALVLRIRGVFPLVRGVMRR